MAQLFDFLSKVFLIAIFPRLRKQTKAIKIILYLKHIITAANNAACNYAEISYETLYFSNRHVNILNCN